MKRLILTNLLIWIFSAAFSQTENNTFKNFEEFTADAPTGKYNFQIKQRTIGNVVMMGGVTNHRLKKIKPSTDSDKLNKFAWGVKNGDSLYINSYPYSKILGFNKIRERGYYSYFMGEPARTKQEQLNLGMIKEGDPRMSVCCWTGFVILNTGEVKHLRPKLVGELIQDNDELYSEFKSQILQIENVHEMFEYLSRYNKTK
ncbi:MAG: DUF6563 family protein [Reichenbachiella sp.]|uniref:DUF6563 family protein n=1 Tax=Reichenbachiella sp. TaxID=2184521 RepID=UPI003267B412